MRILKNPFHCDFEGEHLDPKSMTRQDGYHSVRELLQKYASGMDLSAYKNNTAYDKDPVKAVRISQGTDVFDMVGVAESVVKENERIRSEANAKASEPDTEDSAKNDHSTIAEA